MTSTGAAAAALREAEVEDFDLAVGGDNHVRGLEVAVHDAPRVRGGETVAQLDGDMEDAIERQRPAQETRRERLPRHIFHDDVRDAIGLEHVVDACDVRVVERGGRGAFLHQAPELFFRTDALDRQPLECDGPAKPRVLCEKDFAHPARTDLLEYRGTDRPLCAVATSLLPADERLSIAAQFPGVNAAPPCGWPA